MISTFMGFGGPPEGGYRPPGPPGFSSVLYHSSFHPCPAPPAPVALNQAAVDNLFR